jgi:predicted dehydrogenase
MSLRAVVVGCGKIADGHAEAIKRTRGLGRLVAACDIEPIMAEQFALRMNVPGHYSDYDRMLAAEQPDVVHITTPPGSHVELAVRAMNAGAHVLCEKPLAPTHADACRIIEHAKHTGRKLTVCWEYIFDPPAVAVRELVASGVIGEVVHVESTLGFDRSGDFGDMVLKDPGYWVHNLPGKLFHNVIDHLLNKILEFVQDEHPKVIAHGYTRRPERFGDRRDETLDELRLVIAGERTTAYGTFSADIRPVGHFVRLYGTTNSIHADFNMRTVVVEASPRFPSAIGRLLPAVTQGCRYLSAAGNNIIQFARNEFHYFEGMKTLVGKFYESVASDAPLPISYSYMHRVSAVLNEIIRRVPQGEGEYEGTGNGFERVFGHRADRSTPNAR